MTNEECTQRFFYSENLGCGPAQVDLDKNVQRLMQAGFKLTEHPEQADVLIIQTCSFLASVAEQSIKRSLNLADVAKDSGQIIVSGCAVDTERQAFELAYSRDKRFRLLGAKEQWAPLEETSKSLSNEMTAPKDLRISRGCASTCSYCSIRFSQGRVKSVSLEKIVEAIEDISPNDQQILNLHSEDVGSYGLDINSSLPELLSQLHRSFPTLRFRLNTISPIWFHRYQQSLLEFLKEGVLDKSLYCPAQSGSTKVLKLMRRGYTSDIVHSVYSSLFEQVEEVRLLSDFILGHPGETEEDARETIEMVSEYPFDSLAIWAFEEREGTRAISMRDSVPFQERESRVIRAVESYLFAKDLRALSRDIEEQRGLSAQNSVRSNVRLPGIFHRPKIHDNSGLTEEIFGD